MSILPKVTKYQIYDAKNAVLIYYLVILSLVALVGVYSSSTSSVSVVDVTISSNVNNSGLEAPTAVVKREQSMQEDNSFNASGLEGSTAIFLFVLGLNLFKTSFKFLSANGVTRRRFFRENTLAIMIIAALLTIIDTIMGATFKLLGHYQPLYEQIYGNITLLNGIVWAFAYYLTAIMLGWFITMLYYRSSSLLKIVISISPAIVFIGLTYLNRIWGHVFSTIGQFFIKFWSINNLNSYVAARNLLLFTVLLGGLVFLLMRRAPVKD